MNYILKWLAYKIQIGELDLLTLMKEEGAVDKTKHKVIELLLIDLKQAIIEMTRLMEDTKKENEKIL